MKKIIISIKPEWVEKILNGEKTIEIRKTMPKCKLPCEVYIYCTKGNYNKKIYMPYEYDCFFKDECSQLYFSKEPILDVDYQLNGKVVAKFTLNHISKVVSEEYYEIKNKYDDETMWLEITGCMAKEEVKKYGQGKTLYEWLINDLEIFDKPKELSDFGLKRPPQSWQYIN